MTATPRRIVFVCAGNICRSPVAARALRRALAARGMEHVRIASFGLVAQDGDRPCAETLRAAAAVGLDLRDHEARRFSVDRVEPGDLYYVMENHQRETIRSALPECDVTLLGSLLPAASAEIADPENGSDDIFDECIGRIVRCVDVLAASLSASA